MWLDRTLGSLDAGATCAGSDKIFNHEKKPMLYNKNYRIFRYWHETLTTNLSKMYFNIQNPAWTKAIISKPPNCEHFSSLLPHKIGMTKTPTSKAILTTKPSRYQWQKLHLSINFILCVTISFVVCVTTVNIWKTITNVVRICLKFGSVSTVSGRFSFDWTKWLLEPAAAVSIMSSFVGVIASKVKPFFVGFVFVFVF